MTLAPAMTPLIDLLYPPRCPRCGGAVATNGGLCAECWGALTVPGEPACALCQTPLTATARAGDHCRICAHEPPRHTGICAATVYNDASRDMVLAFKNRRRLALARVMAGMMAARIAAADIGMVDAGWLLVPVPLHRWRLWRRGYNQSALLAAELSRLTGAPALADALHRVRQTPSLGGLGREARAAVMEGAIRANPHHAGRLSGAKVLLVDDVLTSGATSNACVAALVGAGAQAVAIACFARVCWPGHGEDHVEPSPNEKAPEVELRAPLVTKQLT